MTNRQKQFIIGTILGGSTLQKSKNSINPYLTMISKNKRWLLWKINQIGLIGKFDNNRWRSKCYPELNDLYDKFYKDGKRNLTLECMEGLHDVAFTTWFGDCGKSTKKGIILNVNVWKKVDVIKEYFTEIGYKSKIFTERGWLRIILDIESSKDFYAIAQPNLPYWFNT